MKKFADKVVFITGASSGIGAAMAFEFAKEGAHVALAARREDKLEAVASAVRETGSQALALRCDVTDRSSVDSAVAQTVDTFGGLDVAVANAGFGVSDAFQSLETDDFRRQFETNVFGAIDTAYAALPHLVRSKGRLVFISSVSGLLGLPTSAAYCASKFALCGLAESIYFELADEGISVTCVSPGWVASEFRAVDNDGIHRAGKDDPMPAWLVAPADKAARQIVRAIHRRKFEAVITGHGKLAVLAHRLLPRTFRGVLRLATRGKLASVQELKRGGA